MAQKVRPAGSSQTRGIPPLAHTNPPTARRGPAVDRKQKAEAGPGTALEHSPALRPSTCPFSFREQGKAGPRSQASIQSDRTTPSEKQPEYAIEARQ